MGPITEYSESKQRSIGSIWQKLLYLLEKRGMQSEFPQLMMLNGPLGEMGIKNPRSHSHDGEELLSLFVEHGGES